MRLGLIGGTFDPVHFGHLAVASAVADKLELDEVWFLPAGQPWMKYGQKLSSAHARIEMLELAVASKSKFKVCTAEIERAGNTYTKDTLEQLIAERGPEDVVHFIMGADTFERFSEWKDPERVLELATVVVAKRVGYYELNEVEKWNNKWLAPRNIVMLETPIVEVSATEVRRRVQVGEPIAEFVPEAVAEYIQTHGLYRTAE